MREERGQLSGDVTVFEPFNLWGNIGGNVTVIEGGKFYVRGALVKRGLPTTALCTACVTNLPPTAHRRRIVQVAQWRLRRD